MSVSNTVFFSSLDGSLTCNKAFVSSLLVSGNTSQPNAQNPSLLAPSGAFQQLYQYSWAAPGVLNKNLLYPVIQDSAGRAVVNNDLVLYANIYGLPPPVLPANINVTSLIASANLASNTFTTNTASISSLTTGAANVTGSLVYSAASGTNMTLSGVANVQNVMANNVSVTSRANVGSLNAPVANITSLYTSNLTGWSPNVSSLVGQTLYYNTANVSTLAAQTANVATLFCNSLPLYQPNVQVLVGNSLTYQIGNISNLTSQVANVGTLFCSNVVGLTIPPAANLTNVSGNSAVYTTVLAGNIGPLAQVGNALSNLNIVATNLTAGAANIQAMTGNTWSTGLLLAGNIGPLAQVGNVVSNLIITTTTLTSANVRVTQQLTGNVCNVTTIGANVASFGNLLAAQGNVASLGANVIFCSNVVGLTIPSQVSLTDISGNSASYTTVKAATVLANAAVGILTPTPAFPLDVAGAVRATTNTSVGRATALRVENLGSSAGGAIVELASQFSGLAQANKVAAQMYAEPDSGTGGRFVVNTCNTAGVLQTALNIDALQRVGVSTGSPAYPLDVGGTGRIPTLLSSNVATSAVSIPGNGPITFAYDNTSKDPNAGVIGYQRFSATCLDIIGAGSGPPNRAVRVWETLGVGMTPTYPLDVSGTGRIPSLLSSNAQVTQANVVSLGATTLFCSNIVGYSPAQTSLTDISGNSATYSYVRAQTTLTAPVASTGGGTLSASNPYFSVAGGGDLIGLKFGSGADRYGLALNGGVTRVITSGVNATAQVGLSLASTDGPGASATGFTDLLYASNSGVTATRPFTAQTANVSTLFCSNIVGYSPAQAANLTNISGNSANYAQLTTGNLTVQPASTDVSAINPDAYNTLMVYEDCSRSSLAQGYLTGSASYTSGNGYVVLTAAATSLQGQLNYQINPGTSFDVTAELFVGTAGNSTYPADGFSFFCFNNGATNIDLYQVNTVAQGYVLSFSDYANANVARGATTPAYSVMLWYNGTLLASQSYTSFSVPVNTWTQLRISFIRNVWRVWLGTTQVINYQDISRTLVGPGTSFMGFEGQTGGFWASHLIRNIQITKHTQGPWRPAAGGNAMGISYNGTVTVAGPLNTTSNLSTSQHAYVAGNAYITGPIVQNLGADPGEFIYSRYSGGIGDRFGVGQWPGGKMRVFCSSTYGPAFCALSIASTDTLGPSGSNFQDIVVASSSAVNINKPLTVSASMMTQQSTAPGFFMGPSTAAGQAGYMVFNNSGAPSGPSVLGLGVTGMPLGTGLSINANGNVGIGQSSPAYLCDVGGSARVTGALNLGSAVAMPANNIGDWLNTNYTPNLGNPSDRYGVGQFNNGAMRLFCSSYYNAATVNISLASADSTGGGGTFTDLLTASNTAIVMRRPVTVNAAANTTHFLQGQGYQNLFLGNSQSASGCGFLTFNNPTSPGYANSLGIGVYSAPGGMTCSPNGSVGVSQTNPSASTSLDIYGPVRAQLNNVSQTYINSGGSYTISGGSALTNSTVWNPITFGNINSTDVTSALWGTNASLWTIPVSGVYHMSFDGTASATTTFAGYWTFNRLGGSSTNASNLKLGASTCSNNLYLHCNFTMYLQAGDQPQFVFASGSTGSFGTNAASVRIVLLNRC